MPESTIVLAKSSDGKETYYDAFYGHAKNAANVLNLPVEIVGDHATPRCSVAESGNIEERKAILERAGHSVFIQKI